LITVALTSKSRASFYAQLLPAVRMRRQGV
jgi:hypothetical protein